MSRSILVIGAGLSGVAAARELVARGHRVVITEKSPGIGGRMATRRIGPDRCDHGAAFLTIRDPAFRAALDPLVREGRLEPWADRLHRWDGTVLRADPLTSSERRFAARDGMASIVKALAQDLRVELGAKVVAIGSEGARWRAHVLREPDGAQEMTFDALVIALPAPQALVLAETAGEAIDHRVRAELARVQYDPCVAVMARLDGPVPPWRAISSSAGALSWVGIESSKRPSSAPRLVLHAAPEWSRSHEGASDAEIVSSLAQALSEIAGPGITLAEPQVKRWRYARPTMLAASRALLSEQPPAVFCGDWAVAPRVEGAFLSGLAAAERLIGAGYA